MRSHLGICAGVVLTLPGVASAQETRVGVDVSATGGYSNNPFAEVGNDTGSAFAALDVKPQLKLLTEHSAFTLSGQAHVQEYVSRYPVTDSYTASLDYRGHPSVRLSTFGHIDLSSAVLGADDQYAVGSLTGVGSSTGAVGANGTSTGSAATGNTTTGAATPTSIGTGPLISDIGLLGTRDRRRSIYATAGGTDALSAHDSLSLSGFVDIVRYSDFGDRSNYNGYGGTLSYSRQVASYFSAGVQGSAAQYDYQGVLGTTHVYAIQATASGRLSRYWTLNGALGASFITTDSLGASNRTSLSGNINLCRQTQHDTFCALASRQARATGFNGAQYVTSAGGDWQHRIDVRSRLTLDAAYLQEGGITNLNGLQDQYLRVSATYDRELRQRLRILVSGRYRQIFGGQAGQAADYGGQIGFSYRFGDLR